MKKPNLLVIGASGAVAMAFLHYLDSNRYLIGKLILIDKKSDVLDNPHINHRTLNYIFLRKQLSLPKREKEYHNILKRYKIDIVLDLSTMDTIPLFDSTNKFGATYLGTAANSEKRTICDILFEILKKRNKYKNAVHILCSGMNPGVVNMWVRMGVEEYGVPDNIVHFEYDSSMDAEGWRPIMTWSVKEFIEEVVDDPSTLMLGGYKTKKVRTNSLMNRVDMKKILKPVMDLDKYPYGFTVPHEECTTIAWRYDIPSKYIYAFDTDTMERLIRKYKEAGRITSDDLIFEDNTNKALDGSDSIGVLLNYKDKIVCYFNSMPNQNLIGTNATCTQVIIGVYSGLFTLIFDGLKLKPGIYFPEDLYGTHYRHFMTDNMRTQKYVFRRTKKGLKSVEYVPDVKLLPRDRLEHLYIF